MQLSSCITGYIFLFLVNALFSLSTVLFKDLFTQIKKGHIVHNMHPYCEIHIYESSGSDSKVYFQIHCPNYCYHLFLECLDCLPVHTVLIILKKKIQILYCKQFSEEILLTQKNSTNERNLKIVMS